MKRPLLKDKQTFTRMQSLGLLGNYFRMWDTVQGVRDAGYTGWLTVRSRKASDKALFIPAIPADCLYTAGFAGGLLCAAYEGYGDYSACMSDVYLQEIPAPNTGRIINLEASIGHSGSIGKASDALLYVKYALNDPQNLRHSLERNGTVATGIEAMRVLRAHMQEDRDRLYDIWDRHPNAVIEASRFTQRCGVFHSQTVIWEVREY